MSDSDREHARALLEMARKDARALPGMTDSDVFADEISLLRRRWQIPGGAEREPALHRRSIVPFQKGDHSAQPLLPGVRSVAPPKRVLAEVAVGMAFRYAPKAVHQGPVIDHSSSAVLQ